MAAEVIGSITVISNPSSDANSYASIAKYKEVLSLDVNKDISGETDESIAARLINATRQIDFENSGNFLGELYDDSYALQFPRKGLVDYRGIKVTDYTVFPDQLILATIYQSYYIDKVDYYSESSSVSGVKRQEMEGLGSQEFFDPSDQKKAVKKDKWAKEVGGFLNSFLLSPIATGSSYVTVLGRG